ncbi:MAG: hypothetical protein FJ044_01660 [Candidatus Cloacimonetes bacterium]|nr:hypothetical protein [Candidatus Cloacimonadota bacterium]
MFAGLLFTPPAYAGTTPPTTTHTFTGTIGENGWFTSTVDVVLRAQDLESGPAETTYWLNDDTPTTQTHTTSQNQILNPSFENGWFLGINNWDSSGPADFWRSSSEHKFGWRSAAILATQPQFAYWHNRNYPVPVISLQNYSVSAWVKTFDIAGLGAYFEVWAKGASLAEDQLLATSEKLTGINDWTLLAVSFIMPEGFSKVYLKLGATEEFLFNFVYWDGVTMYGGYSAITQFTVSQNGNHTLHYYSKDNNGNTEVERQANLKIDTRAPSNWENFTYTPGRNSHSYYAAIEVTDPASGIDVSTAQYRWYTNHRDWGWSDWLPVNTVTKVSNGLPATDGETSAVKLATPEIDFGDSATTFRVQFRVSDMAGNSSDSPIQTIEGPWLQLMDSDLCVNEDIFMTASAPAGMSNANSLIAAGGLVSNFTTSSGWKVENYSHELKGIASLSSLISEYAVLKSKSLSLPQGKLPTTSGIYKYPGNYTIDHNTTPPAFEDGVHTSIIIIEGNLRIKHNFSINENSAVVFLVEGDSEIEGKVENIAGFFMTAGVFNTNIDNKQQKQLTLLGGTAALEGFILGRDLGRTGTIKNSTHPAEKFIFQPKYLVNSELSSLLAGKQIKYSWREVAP